ncbi:hypothetical protein Pcinc_023666 [Petrolisthes cinctipes]|uniref:PHD finger protein 12 n=1 Tax=Petrolisthes cinctipes TaxID=88211 RepID=A0AAE1FDY5_PETCI|nr:hypothetical protein Pcinc_023666 [Petrolisthes cinctipes]
MASMEYDVESMSGLMPQILALTAPPGNRDPNRQQSTASTGSSKEGLAAHPYFRRPGRGHNHDSCDACAEGGDLICCDVCPASFHLMCHDPPLSVEDIPIGRWACHQCRVSGPDDDRTSVSSGKSNKSNKGLKRKEKEESTSNNNNDKRVCSGGREFEVTDSPLLTLVKAAATINPKQFILPYEMTLPASFPGEPKSTGKGNGNRRWNKKKAYELDNGLVPLPAKLCFTCNKSCRTGPLVPCDYCQLFFHLDCLDPPLTTPPMGKWMCPNHPEHFVDSTLLTSHSLTERVKLWDKFSTPMDQDAVRLRFFQKCHRTNPPFRYKVKRVLRSRIRVPQAVKNQYSDPPDLLPKHGPPRHLLPPSLDPDATTTTNMAGVSGQPTTISALPVTTTTTHTGTTTTTTALATATTTTTAINTNSTTATSNTAPPWTLPLEEIKEEVDSEAEDGGKESTENEMAKMVEERRIESERKKPTKEEMDEWLAGLLCLQASIVKHMANNNSGGLKQQRELNGPTSINTTNNKDTSKDNVPCLDRCINGDLSSHELNIKHPRLSESRRQQQQHQQQQQQQQQQQLQQQQQQQQHSGGFTPNSTFQPPQAPCLPAKKGILKNQKGKSFTNLGIKPLRQRKQTASEILSETLTSLASSLQSSITGKQEVSLSQLERSVVDVLAWQRLEELLCPPGPSPPPVHTQPLPARALLCPLVPDAPHLHDWAVKSPAPTYSSQPVPMAFRVLRIGKGSHNHLDLSKYGHCNYVSQEHAAIFFDENTGHYELLNYSGDGSRVDGVEYRYDPSDRTVHHAPPPPLLQQVRAIIDHKRRQSNDASVTATTTMPGGQHNRREAMTDSPAQTLTRCMCQRGKAKSGTIGRWKGVSGTGTGSGGGCGGGWEGGAVLHHGSHLRFGCIQFVFSIVEEASKADWVHTTLRTYEKFFKQAEEEMEEEEEEAKTKEETEEGEGEDDDDEEDDNKKKERGIKS